MAAEKTSAKQELIVIAAPEDAVPDSADDKGRSSMHDCKPLAILARKEAKLKVWRRAEVTIICVVIVIVWGLLALPIVFYNLSKVRLRTLRHNIFTGAPKHVLWIQAMANNLLQFWMPVVYTKTPGTMIRTYCWSVSQKLQIVYRRLRNLEHVVVVAAVLYCFLPSFSF